MAHPVDRALEDRHLGAKPERDDRRVVADDPAADDDDLAGATPGTPPSSSPRPPNGFSRKYAPACAASRPATSDIGASSGSAPPASRPSRRRPQSPPTRRARA